MNIYAVIDTNVFVSALLSKKTNTATVLVLRSLITKDIIPLYNQEILNEYEEVLKRKKFHLQNETVNNLIRMIKQYGLAVNPMPTGEVLPDMDDLVFYEVTMEKREDDAYLITGNIKHFPKRDFIVTPAEMMQIIEKYKNK